MAAYYDKISKRLELERARESIKIVRDYSGIGENSPLTHSQDDKLYEAYKLLGQVLQTIREG